MSKDHFYFSRNDRIVALILLIILLGAIVIRTPFREVKIQPALLPADTVFLKTAESGKTGYVGTHRNKKEDSYSSLKYSRSTTNYRDSARIKSTRRETVTDYSTQRDTAQVKRYKRKQRPVSAIDLNGADSSILVTLPGIGPYYASRIIRYRKQLGGYFNVSQITEIEGLPDSLMNWFVISDTASIVRIHVNEASLGQLRSHPYINFYQARSIIEFRKQRGKIKNPDQLSFMEEFTDQDLIRLEPYLDYR